LDYLYLREKGVLRKQAANIFTKHEMKGKYGANLEKMFNRCVNNAKAIFPHFGNHNLNGFEWIKSVINESSNLLNDFNRFCLEHSVNAILCNRANILVFKKNKKIKKVPLKKVHRQNLNLIINSG
jgi:hypothetical protein